MTRPAALFLFLSIFTLLFSQDKGHSRASYLNTYLYYEKIYQDAARLSFKHDYNEETEILEIKLNRQALEGFRSILPVIEKDGDDSLAFHCYYRIGTLEHYFDSLDAALASYLKTIALGRSLPALSDSFRLPPYLFTGSIYYDFNQFDSALKYYDEAEKISTAFQDSLEGANRLYNSLGALLYEMGNYRQAGNYFEKSIDLLSPAEPYYRELLQNYKINLASTLNKIEEYDKADGIYKELLSSNIYRNEILHNLGTIRLNTGALRDAIKYFRQVRYNNSKNIRLYNDIGFTYSNLGLTDSARIYFDSALLENVRWNGSQQNAAHGQTLKYIADDWAEKGNFPEAARQYQQSVLQFYHDFNDTSIYNNPRGFSGVFSYINLFHALVAKGDVMKNWFNKSKHMRILQGSLHAYQSAYDLADYVERIYDSDEARLFLNKIKHTVHSKPIEVSLQLFELTKDPSYLEAAYAFDQQNKASVLSLNITRNEISRSNPKEGKLAGEEASLRSSITWLSLKAGQTGDSSTIAGIKASIRDKEIALGKLHEQMNADPAWQTKYHVQRIPAIREIQEELDVHSALISYHLAPENIVILLVSANGFEYYRSPVNQEFLQHVETFRKSLSEVNAIAYDGFLPAMALYEVLVKPLEKYLSGIDRLVLIPDDELHYLPFEALQDENRKYLVEKFSVQYLYSTALMKIDQASLKNAGTLAIAPFTSIGFSDTAGHTFEKLPASMEEVSKLKGKLLTDSAATKRNFLTLASRYSILHLATHAQVNNDDPLRSFIAFYPDGEENKLYAAEIYDLDLRSSRLVILSACETGAGRLVKGEGILSLSRAFAYAGCPNIITSLWKAEDKTTAYLTRRLHHYLGKGYSRDKALQRAKLDLLESGTVDPRFKTPNYWAHLFYIGEYEPETPTHTWWWIGGSVVLLGLITWWIKKRKHPEV